MRVLYDITDDWSKASGTDEWLAQVREDDRRMCEVADSVVVCSQDLFDSKAEHFHCKVRLVPNGVDASHFAMMDEVTVADELREVDGSVLGYSGTVHPDRLDVGLVAEVARTRPDWTWVFVGPSHLCDKDRTALTMENVLLLGPKPYSKLPCYLARFDVCVTPHRRTAFTESLNPIKLWEYLAMGRPIVATPVAGFRDFPECVRLAGDARQWVAAVEAALVEGSAKDTARRAVAREHSWSSRVDELEAILVGKDVVRDATCASTKDASVVAVP